MKLKLALLVPDTHRPYHSKRATALMLEVAAHLIPDEIVILGDYGDYYSISSHQKDPRLDSMLEKEMDSIRAGLTDFDRLLPLAQKIFISGNHEHRLERYLTDKAPALFGLTSIPHLLEINRRPRWQYIPYGPDQKHMVLGSYLMARHEPLANNAKLTAAKALCSLVYGHIHRIEESHIVGLDGTNHVAFSVGWLGDKRYDVYNYVKHHHQWQLGFGLVYVDQSSRLFYHQKIHILEHGKLLTCVVNGKRYTA